MDLRDVLTIGHGTQEWVPPESCLLPIRRRRIASVGISHTVPDFFVSRTNPWHDTLLLTTNGTGEVWSNGGWDACPPGTGYWAPAGEPHAYRCPVSEEWRLAWLTAWPTKSRLRRGDLGDIPRVVKADQQDGSNFVSQYCREASRTGSMVMLDLMAELLILALGRLGSESPTRRLDELWLDVESRLDHDWSLGELARHAHLSHEQLRAVCCQERGEPPVRYLTMLRMRRAATLLTATSDTVDRVARQVGYTNAYAFSTAFKRHFGSPPRVFRVVPGLEDLASSDAV